MSGFVGRLQARLGLDSAEFSNKLRGARQEAQGFSVGIAQSMRALTSGVLGFAAVGASIGAAGIVVRNIMRDVAEMGDEAARAGVNVEVWQEWAQVMRQNRIPLDALTDGFKELNLRADEFIITGSGAGAEAFQRLGFDADDLARRLQDPSELLLEIMRRLQRLDTAARIRITDEIFGGSAGERFVQLVDRGADSLSATIRQARELGVVMDDDVVARATILNQKFDELTGRARTFMQTLAVGIFAGGIETSTDALERMFGSLDRARAIMGDDWFEAVVSQAGELTQEVEGAAEALSRLSDRFDADATRLTRDLADVTGQLSDLGMVNEMIAFDDVVAEVDMLIARLRAGEIGAEDFETEMRAALERTLETMRALDAIDGVDLTDAISRVMGLRDALSLARDEAQALRNTMPGELGMTTGAPPGSIVLPQDLLGGRRSSPPPRAPNDPDFDLPPLASGGGGSSEGYAATVEDIRARTDALLAEAAALAEVAASGQDYGNAAEYAAVRAEMLVAAQEDGRTVTPELRAEIDAMAQAYVAAGLRVEDLTEALERQREAGQRGAQALTDVFMAAMQGGDGARNAVARLALELARIQAMRAFQSLAGGGGIGGSLLGLLGSLLGKNARGTASYIGGLSMVGEEGPEIVRLAPGASVTPALESARMLRDLRGGGGAAPSQLSVAIGFDETISGFRAEVRDENGRMLAQAVEEIDRGLPGRVQQISRNPRRF